MSSIAPTPEMSRVRGRRALPLAAIIVLCGLAMLSGCDGTIPHQPGAVDLPSTGQGAGMISRPSTDPSTGFSTVRGQDVDANRVALNSKEDSNALVCTTPQGQCFTPKPMAPGAACLCASETGEVTGTATAGTADGASVRLAAIVPIFYATDRNFVEGADLGARYGTEWAQKVTYGVARVSIPATHQTGVIEGPPGSSFVRISFLENAAKHVLLTNVTPLSEQAFFDQLNADFSGAGRPDALVFVHGFNVTFADGAKRAAQISYDLGFRGSTVLYSWPSKGSPTPLGYTADGNTIRWSQKNLTGFLQGFLARTSAKRIYLVAHSMGTQALSATVADLANLAPAERARIKEIVLAAPDIDADIFKRDLAPAVVRLGAPITIYASSDDLALKLSRQASARPRMGDNSSEPIAIAGLETVDATGLDMSFLGHSTFANTRLLIQDWQYIIDLDLRASQRAGLQQVNPAVPYWRFKK
jgi:esterase/lipase superfamily enzyme